MKRANANNLVPFQPFQSGRDKPRHTLRNETIQQIMGKRFTIDGRCILATLIMPRVPPPCSRKTARTPHARVFRYNIEYERIFSVSVAVDLITPLPGVETLFPDIFFCQGDVKTIPRFRDKYHRQLRNIFGGGCCCCFSLLTRQGRLFDHEEGRWRPGAIRLPPSWRLAAKDR